MSSQLSIQGSFSGSGGAVNISNFITVNTPIIAVTTIALASGFNSVAIPLGATFYMIVLPTGNAVSVTLKGVTGDTGIVLLPTGTNLLQVAAAQTTIGLTAGGAIAALTTIYFM